MRVLRLAAAALAPLLVGLVDAAGAAPAPTIPQAKLLAEKAAASPAGYVPATIEPAGGLAESEPNDTPATANPLAVLEAIDAALGAGDADWFHVTAAPGTLLTLSTSQLLDPTTDTVLRAMASDGSTLLAMDDDGGAGLFSAIEHFACPQDGAFYVEVRHFSLSGGGSYRLLVEPGSLAPLPPSNDTCASAVDVACNSIITGSTSAATADVSAEVACTAYAPNGPDVFYRVEVPYSYLLRVQVTALSNFDPAVYVLDGCGEAAACVAGADVAFVDEDELVTWVNETEGPPRVLFVGVDSWSAESRGDFTLTVSCEFVVPTVQASWGTLKSTFSR